MNLYLMSHRKLQEKQEAHLQRDKLHDTLQDKACRHIPVVVQAITPIKTGEELSYVYNQGMTPRPIHERRQFYLNEYDFVCNCPRCTALGDDTRQFDCFDKTCSGRHYACQPTSDAVPYLLPCNVCSQSPPKDYEKEMFGWEKLADDHALWQSSDDAFMRCQSMAPKQHFFVSIYVAKLAISFLSNANRIFSLLPPHALLISSASSPPSLTTTSFLI